MDEGQRIALRGNIITYLEVLSFSLAPLVSDSKQFKAKESHGTHFTLQPNDG